MGRRALCHIIDTISTLVEDWYPGLTSGFCENQVILVGAILKLRPPDSGMVVLDFATSVDDGGGGFDKK